MKSFKQFLNAKTRSPEEIAKKHGCSLEAIGKQLEKGIKVEREHSKSDKVAREIALDHLWELKDYYNKLKDMEHEGEKKD